MPKTIKFGSITEGKTKLVVPESKNVKGPGTHEGVFYNPAMRTNRDLTVLFGKAVAKDGWNVLDALGGTGAKGLRLANESEVDLNVQVNDMDPDSFKIIKKNILANSLKNASASNLEFNALLSDSGFDWIDIDPFGSPIKFIDLAVRRASRNGIISITATDTAPLCGTKIDTCQRRYLATPLNDWSCHEFGLRILVGATVRRAAVFDYGLEPVLSYYQGHYFRAFFRKKKGAGAANDSLGEMGYIRWDEKNGYRTANEEPGPKAKFAGPLWLGNLWEPTVVKRMLKNCDDSFHRESHTLLESLDTELLRPPYHYHIDLLARMTETRPLKTDDLIQFVLDSGHTASGVHYSRKGIKTDAGLPALREIFNTACN